MHAGDPAADILRDEVHLLGTRAAELAEVTNVAELEFFAGIADYDPVPVLERLRCPILAIFGEDDVLVPVPTTGSWCPTPRRVPAGARRACSS